MRYILFAHWSLVSFWCSLKVRSSGIDVCAVLPSPVQSNFYNGAHKIDEISFFQGATSALVTLCGFLNHAFWVCRSRPHRSVVWPGTAKGPEVLVDRMFATVGACLPCGRLVLIRRTWDKDARALCRPPCHVQPRLLSCLRRPFAQVLRLDDGLLFCVRA